MGFETEVNSKILDLVQADGEKFGVEELDVLFPNLSEEIKGILEEDEVKRGEILEWINNEIKGVQFNAVRICCVPDEDTSENSKTFSNELCESYKLCPFCSQGIAPVGKPCPLEMLQVTKLTEELLRDLEISVFEDFTDKMTVGEIIIYSLLENRAIRGLACLNLGFSEVTFGKNGKEFSRKKNFYLDIIKDMATLKDKARKSLVATREEKIKLKQTKQIDKAKDVYSETMKRINKGTPELSLIIDVEEDE